MSNSDCWPLVTLALRTCIFQGLLKIWLHFYTWMEIIIRKALSSLLNPPGDTFIGVEGFIFQDIWMSPS